MPAQRRPRHRLRSCGRGPRRRRSPRWSSVASTRPTWPTRPLAAEALDRAGFVVSLEIRRSAVTEHADVVLPVAPAAEKAGRYVDLGGPPPPVRPDASPAARRRSPTAGCCTRWPRNSTSDLGLPTVEVARAELLTLGAGTARAAAPAHRAAARPPPVDEGEAAAGHLARAARRRPRSGRRRTPGRNRQAGARRAVRRDRGRARASPRAALVTVSTDRGSITVPVVIARHARPRRLAADQRPRLRGARADASGSGTRATSSQLATSPSAPADARASSIAMCCARLEVARKLTLCHVLLASSQNVPGFGDQPVWLMLIKVLAVFVVPGRHDAVLDRVRAQGRRPHAEPHRPEPGRPVGHAAVAGRRPEAGLQGRGHPAAGRQAGLLPGADPVGGPGVPGLLGHPVRARSSRCSATRRRCSSPTCPSACWSSSPARRSASTASCCRAGRPARPTRCSAACARRPR